MTFQEKLVVLRKMMGITQDQIASVAGVSRQAVYKWESSQSYPEILTLVKVRDFYRDNGSEFGLDELTIDNLLDDDFVIALPDKKKRRKRTSKDIQREIEAIVEAEESGAAGGKSLEELLRELTAASPKIEVAPKVSVAAAPAAPAAPAAEVVETKEEASDEELAAEADAAEEVAEVVEEAPAKEEAPVVEEEKTEKKKKGFFLFGRK